MRLRTAFSALVSPLCFTCFTATTWPAPIADRLVPAKLTTSADNQSLSGKISAIGDAAFSVEVKNGHEQQP